MEYQKITDLLGSIPDKVPKFITKKWIEVRDQSGGACNTNKQMRFKTSMLRSDLCDYSDAYIVVKGDITVEGAQNRDRYNRNLFLRKTAPFISCISEINGALRDNAEDLDVVIPAYGLPEHSKNYSKTSGSLQNYYRDKPNNPPADNYNADPITNSASFKYKSSITGKTPANGDTKEVEFVVPLKHLSIFWKTLDMSLINCKVSLNLTWSKNCVLTDMITHADVLAQGDIPARPAINAPTNVIFKIKDCKMYVPVVTLSAENDNKLLEQLKTGFKKKSNGINTGQKCLIRLQITI